MIWDRVLLPAVPFREEIVEWYCLYAGQATEGLDESILRILRTVNEKEESNQFCGRSQPVPLLQVYELLLARTWVRWQNPSDLEPSEPMDLHIGW